MTDVVSVQLAISKLHISTLAEQPSETALQEALAELNTSLIMLEATNDALARSNSALAETTEARDLEARRYRLLFERVPAACMLTDEAGVIDDANPAAEMLVNINRLRLHGKPISVFVEPEKRRAFRERLEHLPIIDLWEATFQPRARDRITVQLDPVQMPRGPEHRGQLCWLIKDVTPERKAAATEKRLSREVTLRMEAQATVTRLRALYGGLDQMSREVQVSIPQRITTFLQMMVPRFASSVSCELPNIFESPVLIGAAKVGAHVMEAPITARGSAGHLYVSRATSFAPEDCAILISAANAITALLCSAPPLRDS